MPIHLRKSVKIAPGTRLNFSKRGVSASIGAGGVRYTTKKSGNCLYNLFIAPFVLIFQLYALLFKGLVWLWKKATATPQSRKISLIIIGVLFLIGMCNAAVTAITGGPPTPTIDTKSIQDTAIANAWSVYTQTALALPSPTFTETPLPSPTITSAPISTDTLAPTATLIPTATVVYIQPTAPPPPPAQDHPTGTSGQCRDGTYTSAQHKQGACSHHGGVAIWWGP